MDKTTVEELNTAAMQMILFAGNSRNMINEALKATQQQEDRSQVDEQMKLAKEEITKAHKIQTTMIQSTIEDEDLQSTLLFSHAQDTLMTIYSELNMATHMIKMYRLLEDKVGK